MTPFAYRLDLYEFLRANTARILEAADKIAAGLHIPAELKGRFGISGSNSGCPALLRRDVVTAIQRASREVLPLSRLGDEIRRVVKSVYGDQYDAAPVNTCEAGLWVTYDALIAPPLMGRGEPYRVRCIAPLERHVEHHLSYGRPFPGLYKDIFADRGATAGELGLLGRRQENVDIVMVPLAGARYEVHGVKSYPCPLLMGVDPEGSQTALRRAAETHAASLGGFISLGYDTVGYGYGAKDPDGTPTLQRKIGELAAAFGVPYVSDNAWGAPFIGTDLRKTGADVMLYSMDKVAGAPTSGLVIGREAAMVQIRRGLGIHGERWGTTSAHGKASNVAADPGKEAMSGMLAALRVLRDEPKLVTGPMDETYAIVLDEYERVRAALGKGIVIGKSYNAGGVEINYEGTWANGRMGIPIFSHEDRVAGSNLINLCMSRMGIIPNLAEDGNILVSLGLGTVDENGALLADRMRLAVRTMFAAIHLVAEWAQKGAR